MNSLIRFSLTARVWVLLGVLVVLLVGVDSLARLSVDAVPDITGVQVMVNTRTGALDPRAIEATVTFPLETELAGLPGVQEIRSITKYGLSQIILVFEDDVDIYFARQVVAERLQNLSLPEGIRPELGPVSTGLGEVVMYAVTARAGSALASRPPEERLRTLRSIQDLKVAPRLRTVKGVAEVDSNGGYRRVIDVAVDPGRMRARGVTFAHLIDALQGVGLTRGGGYIEREGRRVVVRSFLDQPEPETLARIPLRAYALEEAVRVGSVARVAEGSDFRVGAATRSGQETVLGTALMRIGANSRRVALDVEDALAKMDLPTDVELQVLYSRRYLVEATVRTVSTNLIEGGALVIAVLILVLRNFRAAVIVALAIPLSMLVSFTGMRWLEIPASLMSLGAIDFGLLVDGSVVMIENVVRRFELRSRAGDPALSGPERFALILEAGTEVIRPVFAGLLVIMIVYVPILSLSGIEGKMFRPMAITVLFALGASLVVAVLLMPVLAYYFLKYRPPMPGDEDASAGEEGGFLMSRATRGYAALLDRTLSVRPRWLVWPALAVILLALLLFTRIGADFIPPLDEGDLVIGLVRDADIGLDESVRLQLASERVIAEFEEVETVFSRIGTPESATDPMGVNFADTFVILKKDRSQWPLIEGRRRGKQELYRAIAAAIEERVPGQETSPTQPIEMRFNEMLEGSRADVSLRIFGPDLEVLLEANERALALVQGLDGVDEVTFDELSALRRSPVVDFRLLPEAISAAGLHPRDVQEVFETAMAGRRVGTFYGPDRRTPVRVILSAAARTNMRTVAALPVELPGGRFARLGDFARLERREQVTTISRSAGRRYAGVSVYLKEGVDMQSFVGRAESRLRDELKLPAGYSFEWGGQFQNLVEARRRLAVLVPLTLAVMLLILWRVFGSFPQALLIFACVPFAATGGVAILFLRDMSFTVPAAIGFIALSGIAVLNGMVMISFLNRLREHGVDLESAVREGALARLRPVLITALVATLGFLPMAFNTGPGAEVQRPLATVVIGGLISSTALTLLLLPALYRWLEERAGTRFAKGGEWDD